jgi:hypothetical protein
MLRHIANLHSFGDRHVANRSLHVQRIAERFREVQDMTVLRTQVAQIFRGHAEELQAPEGDIPWLVVLRVL